MSIGCEITKSKHQHTNETRSLPGMHHNVFNGLEVWYLRKLATMGENKASAAFPPASMKLPNLKSLEGMHRTSKLTYSLDVFENPEVLSTPGRTPQGILQGPSFTLPPCDESKILEKWKISQADEIHFLKGHHYEK